MPIRILAMPLQSDVISAAKNLMQNGPGVIRATVIDQDISQFIRRTQYGRQLAERVREERQNARLVEARHNDRDWY